MAVHYSSRGARGITFKFYRKYDNFYCYQLYDSDNKPLFKECYRTKEEFQADHPDAEIDYSKPLYEEEVTTNGKC